MIVRDDREQFANQVKELVCDGLVGAGLLRMQDAAIFCGSHAVVFQHKGWFGRHFDKLSGWAKGKEGDMKMIVMMVCPLGEQKVAELKDMKR
jgi:hypothetical protein